MEFLSQLDEEALNHLSEVNVTNPDAIMAYTNQAVQIRLGNFERWDEKAKLTRDFLLNLPHARHQIEYVDFSYTDDTFFCIFFGKVIALCADK